MIELNSKQTEAFEYLRGRKNVCITGAAGTGKSEIIKTFISLYINTRVIGVTSLTGVSALLINGTTIHSYLGIKLGKGTVKQLFQGIKRNSKAMRRWKTTETLIIDEISMMSGELFTKLNDIAKLVKKSALPFGGIHLVLVGDFLQLPLIGKGQFCFKSEVWNECIPNTVYLTEIMRQREGNFQDCLNEIRLGYISENNRKILDARVGLTPVNDHGIIPTKIFSHNIDVDRINNEELDKLALDERQFVEYEMTYIGSKKHFSTVKMWCNAPPVLQLCTGAQVMLLTNQFGADSSTQFLCNGARGVVMDFSSNMYPIVKFVNGYTMEISTIKYEYKDDRNIVLARVEAIPLKVAYACSIHKMQGSTLDCAEIDVSKTFGPAMIYSALSRVRTLNGLFIIAIDYSQIEADPTALEFYNKMIFY